MAKQLNRIIFIFSLIGLAISVFLAYGYSQKGPIACPLGGGGCELVRQSIYSSLFGISLPLYGVVFYLVTAFLSVLLSGKSSKELSIFRLLISFSGFAFGVYLTFLEAFVIGAYCFWCVSSFIVSIIIFGLVIMDVKFERKYQ